MNPVLCWWPFPELPSALRAAPPWVKLSAFLLLQNSTSHYNAGTWGIVQGQLRPLLAPRVYTLPMVRSIGKTMVQGKNYGPQITVKRISTRSAFWAQAAGCKRGSALPCPGRLISPSSPPRGRKCKPILVQIARQVVKLNASDLRLPSRAWKVKLVGEGADDAGGVFDDTITEMCQVLQDSRRLGGIAPLSAAPPIAGVHLAPEKGMRTRLESRHFPPPPPPPGRPHLCSH